MGIGFNESAFNTGFAAGSAGVTKFLDRQAAQDLAEKEASRKANDAYNKMQMEEKKFAYKIQQDMAKYEKDLGEADTIDKHNSALKNLAITAEYTGQSVGYDPVVRAPMKGKDGKEVQAVIPSSLTKVDKWRDRFVYGEDGKIWERQVVNGEFTDDLISTNISDIGNKFVGDADKRIKASEMIAVVGEDGKPKEILRDDYNAMPVKPKLYEEPKQGQKATAFEQDKQAYNEYKRAQKEYIANPTAENKEKMEYLRDIKTKRSRGVSEAGEEGEKPDIKLATSYGRDISEDMSTYDSTKSEDLEINFRYTDAYQKNKSLKDMEDDFSTQMVSYEQNKALFDIFDKAVKDGSYKSGIVTKAKNIIGSITPKEFTDLIGLDREAIKDRLGLEGQLGDGVATYLKGLSGTAASQAEFIRTLTNFSKGDMTQEDVRATIFENFVGKKERDLDVMAKRISKRGLTHTGGEWLNRNKVSANSKPSSTFKLNADDAWAKIQAKRAKGQ